MCKSEHFLDHQFAEPMPRLGDAMGELQMGIGLDSKHQFFRAIYAQHTE